MDRKELEKKVTELVAMQISWHAEDIASTMDFINDLHFDSLDAVEIVMSIEDEFGITVKNDDAASLTTVKLVADYLENSVEE